jgi:sulfate permease, SulP family
VAAVGVLFGLAAALFVGMLSAVVLLVIELRRNVVIGVADGRQRRSRRVRTAAQAAQLNEVGVQVRIVELGHWLYFGTVDELGTALDAHAAGARWLILDMRRVAGVDATAARALWMASQRLSGRGVQLLVGGIGPNDSRRLALNMFGAVGATLPLFADIDEALEQAEDAMLGLDGTAEAPLDDAIFPLTGLTQEQQVALRSRMTPLPIPAGESLFAAGDVGDALYLVIRGRFTLWVPQRGAGPLRLLSFGPGLMFGEMALLDGQRRSADAVADTDGEVAQLSRAVFEELAVGNPSLYAAVTRGLALLLVGRLRDTNRLLQERG